MHEDHVECCTSYMGSIVGKGRQRCMCHIIFCMLIKKKLPEMLPRALVSFFFKNGPN